MILIPYSKVNYTAKHSIEEIKLIISEKTGIKLEYDNSKRKKYFFGKYKGEIVGDNFEIIERQIGQDVWTLKIYGQLLQENDFTRIITKVVFNYSAWILFFIIGLFTFGLAGGIYLFSTISGALNPIIWDILKTNLIFYFIYLTAYHFKKFRHDRFLRKILSAERI
jgi:hypothetical protein